MTRALALLFAIALAIPAPAAAQIFKTADTAAAATKKPEQRFWWSVGVGSSSEDDVLGQSTLWYSRDELAIGLRSSSASPFLFGDHEYHETALLVGLRPKMNGRWRAVLAGGPSILSGWRARPTGQPCDFFFCSNTVPENLPSTTGLSVATELAYGWKYFTFAAGYMGAFGGEISFSGVTVGVQIGRP